MLEERQDKKLSKLYNESTLGTTIKIEWEAPKKVLT